MSTSNEPAWAQSPPSAFDIVACWYPHRGSREGPKLRPTLVTAVLRDERAGRYACRVAYGTTVLKIVQRRHLDLIVQKPAALRQMGLAKPTRFDLDEMAMLPWGADFFGCWTAQKTPRIGALTEPYIKEYAFLMMQRHSARP